MPARQPEPVLRAALARELAATPAGLLVTCDGDSMVPALGRGEQVRVRRVPMEALGAGDVILFEIPGDAVELHRLVARLPGGVLVHRGDAADATTGLVRVDRVIGRADLPPRPPGPLAVARALAAVTRARLRSRWRRRPAAPR